MTNMKKRYLYVCAYRQTSILTPTNRENVWGNLVLSPDETQPQQHLHTFELHLISRKSVWEKVQSACKAPSSWVVSNGRSVIQCEAGIRSLKPPSGSREDKRVHSRSPNILLHHQSPLSGPRG